MIYTNSRIVGKEQLTHTTYLLTLESPSIAQSTLPGQFVNIRIDEHELQPLLRRPFSVSWIEGACFEIVVQKVGLGTQKLCEKAVGDSLSVLGPLGNTFRIDDSFDVALLVGGGIGVAPFPILTKFLLERRKTIVTFVGFKTKAVIYDRRLINTHISTDDGSLGFHGTVVDAVRGYLQSTNPQRMKIFSCGPTPMLRSVGALAREFGIPCEVSLETEMACGVGICQGCVVEKKNSAQKYALTCKDGPNFFIDEIEL